MSIYAKLESEYLRCITIHSMCINGYDYLKMNSLSNKEVTPTEFTNWNICRGKLIINKEAESFIY